MKKIALFLTGAMLLLCFTACGAGGAAPKFARGTWEANVYKNEFSGITITVPETWEISTDEEIAEIYSAAMEITEISDLQKNFADLRVVYDLFVQDPVTGTNMNMSFENLALAAATSITEEEYHKISVDSMASMEGISYKHEPLTDYKIGEATYKIAPATLTINGTAVSQVLMLRKIGNHMMSITMTMMNGETTEEMLAMFS